jgi:hypothetical protein
LTKIHKNSNRTQEERKMFDYNNQGFQGYNNYNGFGPQVAQPIKNALTEEEIKSLQQNGSSFSLGLTKTDQLRAKCTHREANGMNDSLTYDPNTGRVRCRICGYEFKPVDASTDLGAIDDAASSIVDILQTIKLLFPTLPADAVGEYFQIIPLIEKIPNLFKIAAQEALKNDVNPYSFNSNNMGGVAMFANLMNAFGNGFMNPQQQFGQQPFMNQPMGQPFVAPQPNVPQGTPFGYPGASQAQGYQPMTPAGYSFQVPQQPTVAPTVAAPAAPATPVESTATDVVTTQVNA